MITANCVMIAKSDHHDTNPEGTFQEQTSAGVLKSVVNWSFVQQFATEQPLLATVSFPFENAIPDTAANFHI